MHGIAGTLLLGGLAPGAAFALGMSCDWMEDHGVYVGLGLACAAYTAHAFVLNQRERHISQVIAFGIAVILALTYPAWLIGVDDFVGVLTARFEPAPMMGVPTFNGVHLMATPMATGGIMAVTLWATTRSTSVVITTLAASIVCGLVVFPTGGASCILWNLCVAGALYTWACPPRAKRRSSFVNCPTCGYCLEGLPSDRVPRMRRRAQ